jgi:hypothetical protein
VAPNWDRTGYEKIPRLVDNIRYRNGHAEAERLPVVANAHSLVPLRTTIVPKPAVAANAHVLLASAVAQPAGTSATHIHAAFLHDLSLVATPLPSGEHLPLVDNPGGTAFPDGVDKTSYWYSLTFRIVPPQVSDDVEVSSFAFSFRRTGMTGGESPRPTLEASLRIVASPEMGEDTKLALANAGTSHSQPLPLDALAATLEIPYMESGAVKIQSLRAEVEQQASTYHFTIALLDDAVRIAYGSLAYPNTFQSQPARLRIAYSYRAYVPIPLNWPQIAFGGKIATAPAALALHVARGATGSDAVNIAIRPALMISPQILLAAQRVRYAIRSVAREQSIDLQFPCSELGASIWTKPNNHLFLWAVPTP